MLKSSKPRPPLAPTILALATSQYYLMRRVQRYKSSIANLAMPTSELLNLMVLLGKKSGGSRTIAILGSFYTLLMKLMQDNVTDWDAAKAGKWDTAFKGSFALRAQIQRALNIEVAFDHQQDVIVLLWDMNKLFDSVRISILVQKLELGLPHDHLHHGGHCAQKPQSPPSRAYP